VRDLFSGPIQPIAIGSHALVLSAAELAALLIAAVALGRLATRLRGPAIVGELLAGIVLGRSVLERLAPGLSGWLFPGGKPVALVADVGQVAVILLVGGVALYVDRSMLERHGALVLRLGLAGLLVPFGLGFFTGYVLPRPLLVPGVGRLVFALFLGIAMGVSALPVIAKTLLDMDLMHRDVAQLILACVALNDTVGWLSLPIVVALATTGLHGNDVLAVLGTAAVVFALMLTAGRWLVGAAVRWAQGRSGSAALPLAAVIILLSGGAVTAAAGLGVAAGALFAGMLLAGCPGVTVSSLASVTGVVSRVLAPVFFATAGLAVNVTLLARPPWMQAALLLLGVAIIGKFLGVGIGTWRSAFCARERIAVAAGMNSRGAVEIIIASTGLELGILTVGAYTAVVALALITSITAPIILKAALRQHPPSPLEQYRRIGNPRAALPSVTPFPGGSQ
jgi:Kef-type K+ transport system membrane component KefB